MRYAIITTEGSTCSPDGGEIENVQILAFVDADNSTSALSVFEDSHLDKIEESGYRKYSCFPEDR